jgi:hypothetical protein
MFSYTTDPLLVQKCSRSYTSCEMNEVPIQRYEAKTACLAMLIMTFHTYKVSRFCSLFSLYHVPQFHVSTVVPRSTLHHWSTPHRCHPTYTIHSHIQYQLSSILQFFLHTRCFPHCNIKTRPMKVKPNSYSLPNAIYINVKVTLLSFLLTRYGFPPSL